jgi:hypothetical protein
MVAISFVSTTPFDGEMALTSELGLQQYSYDVIGLVTDFY